MPGDDLKVCIDQHRDVEPERLDAAGDLSNLLRTVAAGVLRVESQFREGAMDNLKLPLPRRPPLAYRSSIQKHYFYPYNFNILGKRHSRDGTLDKRASRQ
jgi:hypothetical protein